MMNPTLTLIVAAPGRIRDSWQALLKAIPRIQAIAMADEYLPAMQIVADQQPELVLFDAKLTDNLTDVLRQIKIDSPQTRCIVLADTLEQQWLAKNAGADSVLLAGAPADMLFAAVEGILSWPGVTKTNHFINNKKKPLSNYDQKI